MNHTTNDSGQSVIAVGSPNSIARYVSTSSWGRNKWAVFAREHGELVVIAAQSTKAGAVRYCHGERQLVDLERCCIVPMPKGCGKPTRVEGTNGGFMACGSTLRHLDSSVTVEFCGHCVPSLP